MDENTRLEDIGSVHVSVKDRELNDILQWMKNLTEDGKEDNPPPSVNLEKIPSESVNYQGNEYLHTFDRIDKSEDGISLVYNRYLVVEKDEMSSSKTEDEFFREVNDILEKEKNIVLSPGTLHQLKEENPSLDIILQNNQDDPEQFVETLDNLGHLDFQTVEDDGPRH
jgi:hypothetical protein